MLKNMATKRLLGRLTGEQSIQRSLDSVPEVAITAFASAKKQKDANDFVNFILTSLEKNSSWLNGVVLKQPTFRCVYFVGAGPNRFQLRDVIFPTQEEPFQMEFEIQDSEDFDKIGIGALVKLTRTDLNYLLEYVRYRLKENKVLQDDLLAGKAMGVNFAVLAPLDDKLFRVSERFVIDTSSTTISKRKRKKPEPITPTLKKMKRVK